MRKLLPLAVCLLGIGTSHAGLMFERGVDRIRDEARATLASASGWKANDVSVAELQRASVQPLTNYGSIKREYIKFSWAERSDRASAVTATPVVEHSVPEPGTLTLLALGLIAVGAVRRRPAR